MTPEEKQEFLRNAELAKAQAEERRAGKERILVKPANKPTVYTKEMADELIRCARDPVHFIENYIYVQHPTRGKTKMILFDYQREMVESFVNNRNTICLTARQAGKSACVVAFLLWYAMFNDDKTILIAANKYKSASEMMQRVRYAYEELPDFIRPGAQSYNIQSISFDNKSRIVAEATTENTGRGFSISLLYLDEFAFIDPPDKARAFWTSIRPTLSTGGSCVITSTPNSDDDQFAEIWFNALKDTDDNGNTTTNGLGINGFKPIKVTWDHVPGRDEKWASEERVAIGEDRFKREHECVFVGYSDTLINSVTLSRLTAKEPYFKTGDIRWYNKPEPNKIFLVSLDPAMGNGGDNAAIQVYQLPEMRQVAEWCSNVTDPRGQVRTMLNVLTHLHADLRENRKQKGDPEIYWSFENNGGFGEAILMAIQENGVDRFPGTFLQEPMKKPTRRRPENRRGFATNERNKIAGCARLKNLMETNHMEVSSRALIRELKYFVGNNGTFKGKGEKDDLVMATVIAVRMLGAIVDYDDKVSERLKLVVDTDYLEPLPMLMTDF